MKKFNQNTAGLISALFGLTLVLYILPVHVFDVRDHPFKKVDPEMKILINKRDSIKKEYDLFREKQNIKEEIEGIRYNMRATTLLDSMNKIITELNRERDTIMKRIPIVKIDTIVVYKNPM